MTYRGFEVHYCPQHQQNICVEARTNSDGTVTRRCLYEEKSCGACKHASSGDKQPQK